VDIEYQKLMSHSVTRLLLLYPSYRSLGSPVATGGLRWA